MEFLQWTLVNSRRMITLYIIKLPRVTTAVKHGDFSKKNQIFQKNLFVSVTAIGVIYGIIKHN